MASVPVHSVEKAFELLRVLAFEDPARHGIGVRELATRMGVPANSAHNLLKTLHHCEAVAQTESRKYVIGPLHERIVRAGTLASDETREAVAPVMTELGVRLQETVALATLAEGRWLPLFHVASMQPVQLRYDAFPSRNIYTIPTGRVLAAFAGESERRHVKDVYGLPRSHWDGIRTDAALESALAAIREAGYCEVESEALHAFGIGYPVLDRDGVLLAAVGCFAPLYRCDSKKRAQMLTCLREAATVLAGLLADRLDR